MVERLKELRTRRQISQQKLPLDLGISQQSINKYENHNVEPDIYLLKKMADYFAVSVDYLIGHSDIPRRLEAVQRYDLNSEEAEVVEQYRMLTPNERESIRLVMENYIKSRE